MSFLARSVRVAARRSVPRSRHYTTELESIVPKQEWLVEQQAKEHHAAETTNLWRRISWYVCMPAIITCTAWVYNAEFEHNAHLEHLRAENDGHTFLRFLATIISINGPSRSRGA